MLPVIGTVVVTEWWIAEEHVEKQINVLRDFCQKVADSGGELTVRPKTDPENNDCKENNKENVDSICRAGFLTEDFEELKFNYFFPITVFIIIFNLSQTLNAFFYCQLLSKF